MAVVADLNFFEDAPTLVKLVSKPSICVACLSAVFLPVF